jgi:hypothetical protein
MSIEWITVLMFGGMIVLLLLGVPLAFVTGLIALVFGLGLFGEGVLQLIASRIYSFMSEYVLVSVPMFIMMASIMERSGVAKDLFDAMRVWAGKLPGGLAIQTMVAATIMGAMTGIIGGEIVLLGLIALPQMLRLGYERKLAIGTICAGGSLGTMIPPSIVLVIYGLTVNVPIGDLFTANLIPGLILSAVYMIYIYLRCLSDPSLGPPAPAEEREMPFLDKLKLLKGLILPLLVMLSVLGTIYLGIASVTEAAGMGVLGTLIAALARRELNWPMVRDSALQTLRACGMLLWRRDSTHDGDTGGARLHHGLGRHLPADDADLRSHRQTTGLRPGVVRHPILPQHADLLLVAAVWTGGVLLERRGTARRYTKPDFRFAVAVHPVAGARVAAGAELSANRAVVAVTELNRDTEQSARPADLAGALVRLDVQERHAGDGLLPHTDQPSGGTGHASSDLVPSADGAPSLPKRRCKSVPSQTGSAKCDEAGACAGR